MRLTPDPRVRAFVRRMPRTSVYSLVELALLVLLAVQCARLVWALLTPLGPIGDWRPTVGVRAGDPAQAARLRGIDPFFRGASEAGSATLTSLQLQLYGVRVDEATGRGSAILGVSDGIQTSYAIGDEIMPGVTLTGVAYDHVTLQRGGAEEILYIDQSAPATDVTPPTPDPAPAGAAAGPAPNLFGDPRRNPPTLNVETIRRDIRFSARAQGGGVTVAAAPGTATLGQAGLVEGDVIVEAAGRPVSSPADIATAATSAGAGGGLSLVVERGGERVPVNVPVGR